MLNISLRMVDGETPHLDFMTPIGILGFAPIAGWMSLGFAVGKATMLANISFAAVLLPATWWIGASRLTLAQAVFFGTVIIVLLSAIVYGGGVTVNSLSMYYNRWAWAITFIILATVLFTPKVDIAERWLAPLVIGAGMAALAMLKMTFFAPLAPAVLLLLLSQKQYGTALKSVLVGLVIGGALVAVLGLGFFLAYYNDLLSVIGQSSGRGAPGLSFADVLTSPRNLPGSIVLLGSLLVFRKSGHMQQGLAIMLLAPVFAYITYQNWGNDPKWLLLVILYLWVNLPSWAVTGVFNLPARQSILVLACVACTMVLPTSVSLLWSPIRSINTSREGFFPLPIREPFADIWLREGSILNAPVRRVMDGMPEMLPVQEPVEIAGFSFPECKANETVVPIAVEMAHQLDALEYTRGAAVLTADVLDTLWLFSHTSPVVGAAPWYYGDDSGVENAEYLMVPICAVSPDMRRQMVAQVTGADYTLNEVFRSNLLVLYKMAKPEG